LTRLSIPLVAAIFAFSCPWAHAETGATKQVAFALILGVSKSPSVEQEVLRYADDDAARYDELFRAMGFGTFVLSRFDENTLQLHPDSARRARPPRYEEYRRTLLALANEIRTAKQGGAAPSLYFVYAGHGQIQQNHGTLALEDAWLKDSDLYDAIVQLDATRTHVIVDACHADSLVLERGPGGNRRRAQGFVELAARVSDPKVGLFLSSSATGEAHEWEGFQAGVFSHEVRSGLYGAADADGDGRISYRELAGFVQRANQSVRNERYRPQVLARAPGATDALLDLRFLKTRRLLLSETDPGAHQFLEDERGVRVLDFHNSEGKKTSLYLPITLGPLFLKRLSDHVEYVVPTTAGQLRLASLSSSNWESGTRGAAHLAFKQLFALPFDSTALEAGKLAFDVAPRIDARSMKRETSPSGTNTTRVLAWASLGLAAASAATAVGLAVSAQSLKAGISPNTSDLQIHNINDAIRTRNHWAWGLSALSGVAGGTSLALFMTGGSPSTNSTTSVEGVHAIWQGVF
jgi:hypothetical protein